MGALQGIVGPLPAFVACAMRIVSSAHSQYDGKYESLKLQKHGEHEDICICTEVGCWCPFAPCSVRWNTLIDNLQNGCYSVPGPMTGRDLV